MSKRNMNCQAVNIILKIMFDGDPYALAIYTSRGACGRGDIWIANAFGLSRYIDFQSVLKPNICFLCFFLQFYVFVM